MRPLCVPMRHQCGSNAFQFVPYASPLRPKCVLNALEGSGGKAELLGRNTEFYNDFPPLDEIDWRHLAD